MKTLRELLFPGDKTEVNALKDRIKQLEFWAEIERDRTKQLQVELNKAKVALRALAGIVKDWEENAPVRTRPAPLPPSSPGR